MIPDPLRRINNQSLLVGGIILCVGLIYDVPFLELALFWLFPAIVLFFALRLLLEKYIYSHELETNIEDEKIPNLKILRCRFDEATISLLFGKMTSVMSRIAAFMSIILSLGAALLAIMLLGLLAQYTYSEYLTYERCLAQLGAMPNNGQCVIQGDIILIALSALLKAWGEYNVHFFILGFCACVAFIFVTAVFKSLFGRELLYRSLNAIVDVYDTPGGHDFYEVDWCVRSEARVFDLRHSLYTFPETAKKIAAYINEVSESKRHQV